MADFFFFTDPALLNQQMNDSTSGEAFGPISTSLYQLTHRHSSSDSAKAIAVTEGMVVAVDNGSELTLILQPLRKLKETTTLDLPDIKYFIYKGIKRSGIIDESGSEPKIAEINSNDLTRRIWLTQLLYNSEAGTGYEPSLGALSLNMSLADSDSIDKLFVGSNAGFQPTIVFAGDYIGDFVDGVGECFGFEVVLNEVRTLVTVQEAKNQNLKLDTGSLPVVPPLSGFLPPSDVQKMREKTYREKILRYMDPAAFFGSLFPLWEKTHGKRLKIKKNNDSIESFDGKEVYEKFLSKFFNRNRIYIDIRNEYNQSFNYQNVYGNNLKVRLGNKQSEFKTIDYYGQEDSLFEKWPILGIDLFDTTNTIVYQPSNDASRDIEIAIKLPGSLSDEDASKDQEKLLILLYHDYSKIKWRKVKQYAPHEKLFKSEKDTDEADNFLKPIVFELPNDKTTAQASTPNRTTPVATFIKLKVFKTSSGVAPDINTHRQENYLDSLILPFNCRKVHSTGLEVRTFPEDIYMGTRVRFSTLINPDRTSPSTNFISSVGYAFDSLNVTFFTFANRRNIAPARKGPSEKEFIKINDFEYKSSGGFFLSDLNKRYTDKTGSSESLLGYHLLDIPDHDEQKFYKFADSPSINLDTEFSAIIISNSTYNTLINAITPTHADYCGIDPNYDIHLVLRNRDVDKAERINPEENLDPDDVATSKMGYSVYELGLRGFQEDTGVDTVFAFEWNSGILLFAHSDELEGNSKSMIIVEQDVSINNISQNRYLPLYRDHLSTNEISDLTEMIDRLKSSVALGIADSFRPNFDLYHNVFRQLGSPSAPDINDSYYFDLSSTGEVTFKELASPHATIASVPSNQIKGFIMEGATLFAIWNLCNMLSDETKENYLYERLFRILINNGLDPVKAEKTAIRRGIKARVFNPFHHFGQRYSYPPSTIFQNYIDSERYYIFRPSNENEIGDSAFLTVSAVNYADLQQYMGRTSFKEELFNMMQAGNFQRIWVTGNLMKYTFDINHKNKRLFHFPDPLTSKGIMLPGQIESSFEVTTFPEIYNDVDAKLDPAVRNILEKLVGKIANEIVDEFKFLINRNAINYYKIFTKNLSFTDTFLPITRLLATGEGSTTNSLLNLGGGVQIKLRPLSTISNGNSGNLGAYLFTYNLNDIGEVQKEYIENNFPTIKANTTVSVHLTMYGMNSGFTPSICEIELTGKAVGGVGNKVLMRFVADPETTIDKLKLFPEHSLLTSVSSSTPYLDFTKHSTTKTDEERVKLEPFGTSLKRLSPPSAEMIDSDFLFIDTSGKVVGYYMAKWNNLILQSSEDFAITVRVFSGQVAGVGVLPKDNDIWDHDEIQMSVNIIESTATLPPDTSTDQLSLVLSAENLFDDDKFELKSSEKLNLINDWSKYPKAKKTYKELARMIHSGVISSDRMWFGLSGKNIGRPASDETTVVQKHHVIQDSRFFFVAERPRPETRGWTEEDPSSDNVKLPLEEMYHPLDINHDKTRLLEVPDWLPETYLSPLRFSYAEGRVVYTANAEAQLYIDIESFVSPRWSRLDEKIINDYRHDSGGEILTMNASERLGLLNSFTLYNAGAGSSDAYIKLIVSESPTVYGYRGSYNPVLSCLRSFGLMEAIRDNIVYMATLPTLDGGLGLTTTQGDDILAVIQNAIDTVVIKADPKKGFNENITYDLYNKLKWYYSETDNEQYGPTS